MATEIKELMIFHPLLAWSYLLTAVGGISWAADAGYLGPAVAVAVMVAIAVASFFVVRMAWRDGTLGPSHYLSPENFDFSIVYR